MPPRAAGKRSSRLSSLDADFGGASPSPQPVLQKPNLPKLAGTPASRRQYTYGSGVEPPPSRPDRGLRHNQPVDLGNAVGNVLSRHEREDEDSSRRQMPPPPRPGIDHLERDELAGDGRSTQAQTKETGGYSPSFCHQTHANSSQPLVKLDGEASVRQLMLREDSNQWTHSMIRTCMTNDGFRQCLSTQHKITRTCAMIGVSAQRATITATRR